MPATEQTQRLSIFWRVAFAIVAVCVPSIIAGLAFGADSAVFVWTLLITWIVSGIWAVHIYRTGFADSGAAMVVFGPFGLVAMLIMRG